MGDIFNLFDGSFNSANRSSVVGQDRQSFSDIDPENDLIARLSSGSDDIELLVDYSDFTNFVTFNSANSYVTLTADRVLNEYPFGGTVDDLEGFKRASDGYQRYFLSRWPSRIGHLHFNPASGSSYVKVDDIGSVDGSSRSSLLSPGTGSFSVTGWLHVPALTGSNDVAVIFQKQTSSGDGYTVYLTGSSIVLSVVSGAAASSVSGALTQMPCFFSTVCDRDAASTSLLIGTTGTFPAVVATSSLGFSGRLDLGSGSFFIGSGSLSGKRVVAFTGSLDDIAAWSTTRTASELTSSYNTKIFAQPELLACWRFDECTPAAAQPASSIAKDCSGHRLDGRIQSYYPQIRASGSFAYGLPDPILTLDEPSVVSYVVDAQASGTSYDRSNGSLVFNFFPASFLDTDDFGVFSTFALTIARHFDRIKLTIDHMVNVFRVDYGDFDQAPDELLVEVGKLFGLELLGSHSDVDAMKFFTGRGILSGPLSNKPFDRTLSSIKTDIWRRLLLNMMYLHKTRGTAEAVNAIMHSYGINGSYVRLKEYARRDEAKLLLERVRADKSVNSLQFISGSRVSFVSV